MKTNVSATQAPRFIEKHLYVSGIVWAGTELPESSGGKGMALDENAEMGSDKDSREQAFAALDAFKIEIPSWGFANTGTRFGKFVQVAAASTIEEKFSDAAEVNRLTGATPTLALHVLWDLPNGIADVPEVKALERRFGIRSGSINPNLFQDQQYKFGSLCNPSAEIRRQATDHVLDSIEIAKRLGCRDLSLWLPDGSNYPGSQSIRKRIGWLEEALRESHAHLDAGQRL